eukprot:tig00001365_g8357.t1
MALQFDPDTGLPWPAFAPEAGVHDCRADFAAWLCGGANRLPVVDFRPEADFEALHVRPSANLPYAGLPKRWCEMPDKGRPFALLLPEHREDVPAFLRSRGWDVRHWFCSSGYRGHAAALAGAEREGVAGRGPGEARLYGPCFFLERQIAAIEGTLAQGSGPADAAWRVLDVGCGSGRDLAWLCSREGPPRWRGVGLDQLRPALERARALAARAGPPPPSTTSASSPTAPRGRGRPALEGRTFDLVLSIRFFHRPALPWVAERVRPGGLLLAVQFSEASEGREGGAGGGRSRLASHAYGGGGGLLGALPAGQFEALVEEVAPLPSDGRPVACLLARKRPAL